MLFFAALMPSPGIDGLSVAVEGSPSEIAARLARAQAAAVIRVEGESIRFEHPLFAAAIVAARSQGERRAAHARLAALAETAEQHARHLALCREEPDAEVALTVAAAAGRPQTPRGARGRRRARGSREHRPRRRPPPATSATGARSSSATT